LSVLGGLPLSLPASATNRFGQGYYRSSLHGWMQSGFSRLGCPVTLSVMKPLCEIPVSADL
jgi:hypothetical protein